MSLLDIRFIFWNGAKYLHMQDVTELLNLFSATESIDVKKRMDIIVDNLLKNK